MTKMWTPRHLKKCHSIETWKNKRLKVFCFFFKLYNNTIHMNTKTTFLRTWHMCIKKVFFFFFFFLTLIYTTVQKLWFKLKLIPLFSKDALNSKVRVKTFIKESWKKVSRFPQNIKQQLFSTLIIKINVSWASNQQIAMKINDILKHIKIENRYFKL